VRLAGEPELALLGDRTQALPVKLAVEEEKEFRGLVLASAGRPPR
jgi:hypothetical protein